MVRPPRRLRLNPHSVPVDGADLAVGPEARPNRRPSETTVRPGARRLSMLPRLPALDPPRLPAAFPFRLPAAVATSVGGCVSSAIVGRASPAFATHVLIATAGVPGMTRRITRGAARAELPHWRLLGRASFRGWNQIHDWTRPLGAGYWSGFDYSHAQPAPPIPSCVVPRQIPKSPVAAKTRIDVRRALRLRVGEFHHGLQIPT